MIYGIGAGSSQVGTLDAYMMGAAGSGKSAFSLTARIGGEREAGSFCDLTLETNT